MSLSAADFDQDGRLDVYVCAYAPSSFLEQSMNVLIAAEAENFVYHDANNGAQNHLFRNETTAKDGWRFRDVTKEIGLYENNRRWSLAASWEDFDNDGDQDLYVANDYGRNNLYRNDLDASGRRRFADVAATAGVEDSASGMSVSWSDYDQDGWMDIYVSNMYSSAGNRIAYQERFKADAPLDVKQRLQRFARGNTLLQ
ncbi:MAG: VCBS repeat-containing protein, partial [Calditrichaeota bacterium]|nr:VCBS repeat-containing protein [Calditrichota bacterium]